MMWNRQELKTRAKFAMAANRGACIVVALIMGIITGVIGGTNSGFSVNINNFDTISYEFNSEQIEILSIFGIMMLAITIIGMLLTIFVQNILMIGGCSFFIKNQCGQNPEIDSVLDGFRSGYYGNLFVTMFMRDLFIGLWSCLFFIPGLVKSYEYMMIPYILAENPGMDRKTAFKISKRMMDGQKMEAFILDLSFFGWQLLSSMTCGIVGILYVNPYIQATRAELYAFNKMRGFQEGFLR